MSNSSPISDATPITDSAGAVNCIFECNTPGDTTRRKVDPKTIWWPEGVPKPWENPDPPAAPPAS